VSAAGIVLDIMEVFCRHVHIIIVICFMLVYAVFMYVIVFYAGD